MSAPDQPVKAATDKIHIGDVVTQRRPEEVAVNITKEEFLTLCEGDTADTKAKRDKFSSLCWTAFFAFAALIASMQWHGADQWHQMISYSCVVGFLVLLGIFGTAWFIFRRSANEKGKTSHYRRTREKLENDFKRCESPEPVGEKK